MFLSGKWQNKRWRYAAIIVLVAVILLSYGYIYLISQMGAVSPQNKGRTVLVKIPTGAGVGTIGTTLAKDGLIKNRTIFLLYAKLSGQDRRIRAGYYQLSSSWDLRQILRQITGGKTADISITIPEGYNLRQIERLLLSKKLIDRQRWEAAVSSGNFNYPFIKALPRGPHRLEGYLFPDTYRFEPGSSETRIIDTMLRRFNQAYTPELQQRARERGMSTAEVITLASIVEREAKLESERPQIASVFENRLKVGMRLESCATVEYILGKQKPVLSVADTRIESPYNTYLHLGLPPGPIASPGLPSIKAVLYPATTDYLFFVAKGDGSHQFSRTLSEHEAAVKRYEK